MPYTTIAEVRSLEGLEDDVLFPDSDVTEAIEYAEELIDDYCGTSFEHKDFEVTFDGPSRPSNRLILPVLFMQTITSIEVDGEQKDTANATPFENVLRLKTGYLQGDLVTVAGTAGVTDTPPRAIAWAARTIARQYLLDLVDRVPERALSVQSDFGQIHMAQAGGRNRPTSMPDVNAALNRHRHRF